MLEQHLLDLDPLEGLGNVQGGEAVRVLLGGVHVVLQQKLDNLGLPGLRRRVQGRLLGHIDSVEVGPGQLVAAEPLLLSQPRQIAKLFKVEVISFDLV